MAAIAMPATGARPTLGMNGTSAYAQTIVATLNIAGESAGTKKRFNEFSMPIMATATAMVVRNGIMICVSCTVRASLPSTAAKPAAVGGGSPKPRRRRIGDVKSVAARSRVMGSANRIPISTSTAVAITRVLMTRLPRRHAASRPVLVERARERRDEGRGHRPFGKQIAHQIGDAERDVEGVHGRVSRGAEHARQHGLASHAEQRGSPSWRC